MIKIVCAQYAGEYRISCEFSNGMTGTYDLIQLLSANETPLTVSLRDTANFKHFFLQSGALCWKNGLELDPIAIYRELDLAGKLQCTKIAA